MAQNPEPIAPLTQVSVGLHEIWVEITTQTTYPDQLDDLTNRAYGIVEKIINKAVEHRIDIRKINHTEIFTDFEDADAEDEEEAE